MIFATGGGFLAGGIPVHVLTVLAKGGLLEAFQRKGRLAHVLADVPVHVAVNRASIIGAAVFGLALARQ
jgi:glucokinase